VPAKDRAQRRATWNAWYHRTKHLKNDLPRRRAVKNVRRRVLASWYAELKSTLVCRDCGQDHPACIVFHHEDSSTKELGLADALSRGWGKARLLAEIDKCVALCANCHIKLHTRGRSDGA
jgi:hypothetical protein